MGDHQGIPRVVKLREVLLFSGPRLDYNTGDVRCLLDVLGGDLVAKGGQQSSCI